MTQVTWITTHPIYYQTKMISLLNERLSTEAIFLSDISLRSYFDVEFQKEVDFSKDLHLDYKHQFIQRNDKKISYKRFQVIKFIRSLLRDKSKYWVICGWNHRANLLAIIFGRLLNKKLIIRSEASDLFQESNRLKFFLQYFLLKFFDFYWTIGTHNRNYYLLRGVKKEAIIEGYYAVDNTALLNKGANVKIVEKSEKVRMMYVGKLTKRKRIDFLINSFISSKLLREKANLEIVGDGELGEYVADHQCENIIWHGFQGQDSLMSYLREADVLVIPSVNEMWGLVVNEAMLSKCAIIASDQVGSAIDLVNNNENGYIFKADCGQELVKSLERVVNLSVDELSEYQNKSLEIIKDWSLEKSVKNLVGKLH